MDHQRGIRQPGQFLSVLRAGGESKDDFMKLRPMIWGRWTELVFGVFIPALYILPFLVSVSWFAVSLPLTAPNVSTDFRDSAFVVMITLVTITAFLSLGWLILIGPERVNRLV